MSAQATGSNEWKHSAFGCFQDPRLCVFVFCMPMYAYGKNAEAMGEDCLLHGLLSQLGFGAITRYRIRQAKNIQGTMISDVLMHCCLPCCALVQEAREVGWTTPADIAVIGTSHDKMARE